MANQVWMGNIPADMDHAMVLSHLLQQGLPRPLCLRLKAGTGERTEQNYAFAEYINKGDCDRVIACGGTFTWPDGRLGLFRPSKPPRKRTPPTCNNGHRIKGVVATLLRILASGEPHLMGIQAVAGVVYKPGSCLPPPPPQPYAPITAPVFQLF